MDKSAEAPPAWPLEVAALHLFYINAGVSPCVELFSRTLGSRKRLSACERSDGLDRQQRLRRPGEQGGAFRLPRSVILLARRRCGSIRIYLEDALLAKRRLLLDVECKHGRIPPHDRGPVGHWPMQARPHRAHIWRVALRPAVEHAVLAEGWAARRGLRIPARVCRTGRASG